MPQLDDLGLHELGAHFREVVHAVMRAMRRGHRGPEDMRALRTILDESLTRLETWVREHARGAGSLLCGPPIRSPWSRAPGRWMCHDLLPDHLRPSSQRRGWSPANRLSG